MSSSPSSSTKPSSVSSNETTTTIPTVLLQSRFRQLESLAIPSVVFGRLSEPGFPNNTGNGSVVPADQSYHTREARPRRGSPLPADNTDDCGAAAGPTSSPATGTATSSRRSCPTTTASRKGHADSVLRQALALLATGPHRDFPVAAGRRTTRRRESSSSPGSARTGNRNHRCDAAVAGTATTAEALFGSGGVSQHPRRKKLKCIAERQ